MAGGHLLAVRRAEAGAELEERGMLGLEGLVDVFVELLIGAGGLRGIEVAAARDMAVGCVEIEGAGDNVEVAERYELDEQGKRTRKSVSRHGREIDRYVGRQPQTMQRRHRRRRAKTRICGTAVGQQTFIMVDVRGSRKHLRKKGRLRLVATD